MTSPEMIYASMATPTVGDVSASSSVVAEETEETSQRPMLMVLPSSVRSSSVMAGEVSASPNSGAMRVATRSEEDSIAAVSEAPPAISSDTSQAAGSTASVSPRTNLIKTFMGDLSSRIGAIAARNSTANNDAAATAPLPGSPKTSATNGSNTTGSESAGGAVTEGDGRVDDSGVAGGESSARSSESGTNDGTILSEDLDSLARSSGGTHDAVASVSDDEESGGSASNSNKRHRRTNGKRPSRRGTDDTGDPQASQAKSDDLGSTLAPIHEDDEELDDDNADAAKGRLNLSLDTDSDNSGNPQLSPARSEKAGGDAEDKDHELSVSRDDGSSAADGSAATGIFVIGQMIGMGKNEFGRLLRSRPNKTTDTVGVDPGLAPRTAQQEARDLEEGVPSQPTRQKATLPHSATTSVRTVFSTSQRDEAEGVASVSAGSSRREFMPKVRPPTTVSFPEPSQEDVAANVPALLSGNGKETADPPPPTSTVVFSGATTQSVADEQNAQPTLSPLWKFVSIFSMGDADRNSVASQKAKNAGGGDVETRGEGSAVVAAKQAAKEAAKEAFFESRRARSDQEEDSRIPLEVTRGWIDREDDVSTLGGGKYENTDVSLRGGSVGERPFADEEVNDGSTTGAWSAGLVAANRSSKKRSTRTRGSSIASTVPEVQHRFSDLVGRVVIPTVSQRGSTRNVLPNEPFAKGWVEYTFMTIIVLCLVTLIILGILVLVQEL